MNIRFRPFKSILTAIPIVVAVSLSGCGSSGGDTPAAAAAAAPVVAASTIITGTAAAGAPIIGTVSVSDSSANPQPVKPGIPIAADGKYSVDVSGLKAPFAFLADGTVGGKRVQLYSAAVQADVGGTINITPFTDLIVRNIAGTITDTLANAISAKLPNLTVAELDAKRAALTTQLAPVLAASGLSTSIDLLRASFNADNTGLDRFMDLVKVDTTVPTAVKITNILDAANPLTVNTATGATTGGTTLSATGAAATATPVDGILQTFKTFGTLFATSLPSSSNPTLLALFSSTFLDGGESSGAFVTEVTTNQDLIGVKFANGVVIDSVDDAAGIAKVHFIPVTSAGISLARDMLGGAISWQMKKVGSDWLLDGDQRIASVQVRTEANRVICSAGSSNGCTAGTTYSTGLNLWVDDRGQIGLGSAVVTGPGLPAAGVTLSKQPNMTELRMSGGCSGCTTNTYTMTDTEIGSMAAAGPYTYTVKLYSNATTPVLLATYTDAVPVKPTLNSALATLDFPAISSGMVNMAGTTSGSVVLSWTIPTGLWGDLVSVGAWKTSGTAPVENLFVRADLTTKTATSGTSTLAVTAPATGSWTGGNFWISTWNGNTGKVNSSYQ